MSHSYASLSDQGSECEPVHRTLGKNKRASLIMCSVVVFFMGHKSQAQGDNPHALHLSTPRFQFRCIVGRQGTAPSRALASPSSRARPGAARSCTTRRLLSWCAPNGGRVSSQEHRTIHDAACTHPQLETACQ